MSAPVEFTVPRHPARNELVQLAEAAAGVVLAAILHPLEGMFGSISPESPDLLSYLQKDATPVEYHRMCCVVVTSDAPGPDAAVSAFVRDNAMNIAGWSGSASVVLYPRYELADGTAVVGFPGAFLDRIMSRARLRADELPALLFFTDWTRDMKRDRTCVSLSRLLADVPAAEREEKLSELFKQLLQATRDVRNTSNTVERQQQFDKLVRKSVYKRAVVNQRRRKRGRFHDAAIDALAVGSFAMTFAPYLVPPPTDPTPIVQVKEAAGSPGQIQNLPLTPGVVKEWHAQEGWGLITSPDVPGDIWVSVSRIEQSGAPGQAPLRVGESVLLDFEPHPEGEPTPADHAGQKYRATRIVRTS